MHSEGIQSKQVLAQRRAQQQFWRNSMLTFTCGAMVSGALVKFAIDHMPVDESIEAQKNSDSVQKTAQAIADSVAVSAIATPEKITLLKAPAQKVTPPQFASPKPTVAAKIIEPPSEVRRVRQSAFVRPPQVQPVVAVMPPERPVRFVDTQGHWAEYFIQTLAKQQIVRGYGDRTFRPDAAIAPAEFAKMLRSAFPASNVSMSFRDLQAFARNQAPTRAEAAMLIHQTRTKSEMVLSVTDLRIQGEVNRPGRYSLAGLSEQDPKLSKLPTIARAIEYAGGLQSSADLSRVQIHRTTETGQKQVITVNLRNPRHDLVLEQGDEIVIPSSAVANTH